MTRRVRNLVAYLKSKIGYYLYITRPTEAVMRTYFGDNVPPLSELRRNVSLVMVNTHASVLGAKPTVPRVLPVAGIHVTSPDPRNLPQVSNALHYVYYIRLLLGHNNSVFNP